MVAELVVGYSIGSVSSIKKSYIHKKVHIVKDGIDQQGHEIDVLAFAESDKILIAEVTTSGDWNDIIRIQKEKQERLKDFPYDYLLILTAANPDQYVKLDDRTVIGGPKSIAKLPQLVDRIVSDNAPRRLEDLDHL